MTTGETDRTNEPLYLPIEVEGFNGFAEAIRGLKIAGVDGNAALGGSALIRIKDRELENAKNQTRDSLLSQIAGQQLSPEMRTEMEKRINGALGSAMSISEVRAIAASMSAEIREAGSWSAMEKNLNDQQTREERVAQLTFEINQADKKISGLLGDMEDCGVEFDPVKKKRMAELRAWRDAHPDDKKSPEYKEYVALQREMAQEGLQQANDPSSHVTDRDRVKQDANEIKLTDADREQRQKELEEKQKEYEKTTSTQTATRQTQQISEDDEPIVAQANVPQKPIQAAKEDAIEIGHLQSPQTPGGRPSGGRGID